MPISATRIIGEIPNGTHVVDFQAKNPLGVRFNFVDSTLTLDGQVHPIDAPCVVRIVGDQATLKYQIT